MTMRSFLCLLAGCQQTPPANDQLDAVLWTQTSIEHELIYRQLFANATRQLDVALADPTWDALPLPPRNLTGLPPAVVVDIDETLLDNVPLNWCGGCTCPACLQATLAHTAELGLVICSAG